MTAPADPVAAVRTLIAGMSDEAIHSGVDTLVRGIIQGIADEVADRVVETIIERIHDAAAVADPTPQPEPRGESQSPQDAVKRTCRLCGRVGTRRYVQTAQGWQCAPTAKCGDRPAQTAVPARATSTPKPAPEPGPAESDIPPKPFHANVTPPAPRPATPASPHTAKTAPAHGTSPAESSKSPSKHTNCREGTSSPSSGKWSLDRRVRGVVSHPQTLPTHRMEATMSATADLLALLQRHYIKPGAELPGGVFLPEVGWNNGSGRGGCDAIYVGFTSSSGRILVGHELKVSRADWLNELNKPGKADAWADQCHQWWLVVADSAIVHDGELPPGWGLMSPGKSKTRMTVHARADTKDAGHTPSWLAVRSIMARQDTLRAQAITGARQRAYDAATAEVDERVQQRITSELAKAENDGLLLDTLRTRLQALEKALGHNIHWDADKPAGWLNRATLAEIEQIRDVLREVGSVKAAARRLTGAVQGYRLNDLDRAVEAMRAALRQLNEAASANA